MAGCDLVTSGCEGGDESAVGILVELVGCEDPAGKRSGPVVIAGRGRGESEPMCGADEGRTGAFPLGRGPVLVDVEWEEFAPIEIGHLLEVASFGSGVKIDNIDAHLTHVDAHGIAISDDAPAQHPPHRRELDR